MQPMIADCAAPAGSAKAAQNSQFSASETPTGADRADACARILDDLDKELTSRVGADRLQQLRDLLAEVTNALRDSA